MTRSVRLRPTLLWMPIGLLALVIRCVAGDSDVVAAVPIGSQTADPAQLTALRREASRIDQDDADTAGDLKRVVVQIPHAEISGLDRSGHYLLARGMIQEGRVVWTETYYFKNGSPFLVRLVVWSDDDRAAPKKQIHPQVELFFTAADRLVESRSGRKTTPLSRDDSTKLVARSQLFRQILTCRCHSPEISETVRTFPTFLR